ncbi:DUF3307 domain-containing protein [Longispora sp. NPDC051575]|uniref:DUF3307 domain-containing protein n=1 Tax=Longispora sp. NPDC051575 TaxID=3154943 RepID=UPI00343BC844
MPTDKAAVFAAALLALLFAHTFADHWIQTDHQANTKGRPGWVGRLACARHVATYTVTAAAALLAVELRLDLDLHPGRVAAGLAVSAVTHYLLDRRAPLAWLAALSGHAAFFRLGAPRPQYADTDRPDNPSLGTGSYALDQSAHWLFLFVAALIIV